PGPFLSFPGPPAALFSRSSAVSASGARAAADRAIQEVDGAIEPLAVEEHVASARSAAQELAIHLDARFLIRALQLVRLVDRHLRILIAMEEEQRRIGAVD